jgi:hypothetical protein
VKYRCLFALFALALWSPAVRCEHANIDLRAIRLAPAGSQAPEEASAHADQEPPAGGVNPRPLLKVKVGEPLALQFVLTNTYPHGDIKGAIVRYYVVREEKAGQKQLPDRSHAVTEGRFHLNFKPKGRTGARVNFTLKEPGVYLLRVETDNTQSDHEHFSAIDLKAD